MSRLLRCVPVAAFLGVAFLVGCNDKALEVAASADAGKHSGGSLSAEQSAKVLAKVGDHAITLGDFVAALEHMDQFDRLRYQSPERRKELLKEMIDVQLLADEAVAKGYDKDPVAQQEIRSILRTHVMEQAHTSAPPPSGIPASEVEAYYNAHRAQYRDPERRRISVIVLPDDAHAQAVLDSARKATTAAQWGEIVRGKSLDNAAKANVPVDLVGDYGWVVAPGETANDVSRIADELRVAAFQLSKVGDVYPGLVKPKGDIHAYVVRLSQITEAHERSLAESDRSIRVKLVQEKVKEREDALLNRLRSEYPVQVDDAVLQTVKVDVSPGASSGTPPLPSPDDAGVHPAPGSPGAH